MFLLQWIPPKVAKCSISKYHFKSVKHSLVRKSPCPSRSHFSILFSEGVWSASMWNELSSHVTLTSPLLSLGHTCNVFLLPLQPVQTHFCLWYPILSPLWVAAAITLSLVPSLHHHYHCNHHHHQQHHHQQHHHHHRHHPSFTCADTNSISTQTVNPGRPWPVSKLFPPASWEGKTESKRKHLETWISI